VIAPPSNDSGVLMNMNCRGEQKAIENCGMIGPMKVATKLRVRCLALEPGHGRSLVHAASRGPIGTPAASGVGRFKTMLDKADDQAPSDRLTSTTTSAR